MRQNRSLRQALPDYIPQAAVDPIADWFDVNNVRLKISRDRQSKLGDFRASCKGRLAAISVNHNLNQFSFLVTLLHEMAHANVYLNIKKRVAPHGNEWKHAFRELAVPYVQNGLFPEDIAVAFTRYLKNPAASSTSFLPLANALRQYDDGNTAGITVSMIGPESLFSYGKGKTFRMVAKVRKRYRCYCLDDKKTYLFSPLATITPINDLKTGTVH